ncbi:MULTISPECIES: sensor histidine kinase [Methylosinus]|uniref:histidine kinase n=1 Tax=Methylosinus trichosporium (strain ATCC 35070 / NCIMB 11131 / UNIQEM 75 / OB3b) TaxID=595536 RepID=A0A2D2CZ96_METT3|nr:MULTISPECIES: ATP-binding protein [Methylosinus]ATQ68068.1 PAS domain-containing sensor histidine kinase [Methylosinus trichosporium OB3b]OBS51517.1 PAS domain-containing sensor histidine kinase [Methylosinus sp. 3S-1]
MGQPPTDPRVRRRRAPEPLRRPSRLEAAPTGEEAARLAEARLAALMQGVADGVLFFDESGVLVGANAAAERLFGYARGELLGCNISIVLPGIDPSRERSEVEARRKDGARFGVEATIGEGRGGAQRQFAAVLRDFTDARAARAELQALQSELAYARRLSAMGEMTAALTHEINQPFSAVATYVRTARWLLQRKPGSRSPEIEEILDKAGAQAIRAGEIIRRLREFVTRGDSVKTVQRLSSLVDEATTLAFAGRRAEARLSVVRTDGDDFVLADRVQIQQVVVNLMRNAIEAMDGAARRELSLATSVADDCVRLDVADTGKGLDEAARLALFQPFRSSKTKGMGLGLSISRSIVEAHGGRIWAEPNSGGGAIFSFTLPKAEGRPE